MGGGPKKKIPLSARGGEASYEWGVGWEGSIIETAEDPSVRNIPVQARERHRLEKEGWGRRLDGGGDTGCRMDELNLREEAQKTKEKQGSARR